MIHTIDADMLTIIKYSIVNFFFYRLSRSSMLKLVINLIVSNRLWVNFVVTNGTGRQPPMPSNMIKDDKVLITWLLCQSTRGRDDFVRLVAVIVARPSCHVLI